MKTTTDADDILNAIYEHAQVKFECEGCGDDSRDGSKLARNKLDALIAKIYVQGRKDGLRAMEEAWLEARETLIIKEVNLRQEYES